MKAIIHMLVTGIMAVFCCSMGNAQINYSNALSGGTLIYSNAFNGGAVSVNGTAPTLANTILGGTNTATWNSVSNNVSGGAYLYQNGTVGVSQDSFLLPFTPQAGYIYTMTASATLPGMASGKWINWGFAQSNAVNNATPRFADSPVNGYAFAIGTCVAGSETFFAGPKAANQIGSPTQLMSATGTHTLQVILDTTGAKWITAAFVDGTQLGTNYTYASNPPIGVVGIGQTTLSSSTGIQWQYLTLSATQLIISQQPMSAAVDAGTAFTNSVVAEGIGPLSYQWYTNNVPIANATNSTLIINPVSAGNTGTNYYVVITNSLGSITSSVVSLIVYTNIMTFPPSQLMSPDGNLVLTFTVTNFDGSMNCPVYSVAYNGQTVIAASKLGLTFGSGGLLQDNLEVLNETNSTNSSVWQPVYAEKNSITNNYNQLTVNVQELVPPYRLLQLTFRAYDEGAAFCYTIPSQTGFAGATNLTEQTEFRFAANYPTWATYTAQGVYSQTTISGVTSGCERPLPVQVATNLYAAIGEAGLVDYSRMKFAPLAGRSNSLVSLLDGPVTNSLPLTSPWRFIMAAGTPGQLVENDFFILNLNAPCVLTNTAWIKPGKAIREVTLTTQGAMACVDFAAQHNISYIEFDAGWYGPEDTTPTATNAIASLNLPGVISYAASNNIGVILYVNWLAMTNELNLLPPLYQSWGVKGIKYGFVSVGAQQYTEIVNSAAPICASNQMMLDVHDEFRPSGYTRTYPNFMTVEGVAGDETTPTTTQDTTTLFSRMLAGGADHTVCYFDPRVTNWSYAYQLAKAVCFYSPWQFIYWYDRPTNSPGYISGGADMITTVPEMEFYDYLPTVWDETRVLQGSIGQYAVIARRSGTQWFVGAMNANSNRTFNVPLDFLTPGQKYVENVYAQDPTVPTRTEVGIDRLLVDSTGALTMTLGASAGEAVRLLPAKPPVIQSISPLAGGGSGLTLSGTLSLPYSIWASPSLAPPETNWTLLNSGLITNSPFQWNDIFNSTQRFYRSSTP